MAIDPYANCNLQILDNDLCTLETCCLAQSSFLYIPSYGGNIFFAIWCGLMILPQIGLGIRYKTWGFMSAMIIGLALEVIGYAARVQLNNNPFDGDSFLMYLITLTIAPVFISAAIYLCLTRIIVIYGEKCSRFKPGTVAIAFMTSDFLSLLLQAVGGAIADTADTHADSRVGIDIMIAGLVLQAISLAAFLLFVADFAWRCHRGVLDQDPAKQRVRNQMLFKAFMASLLLATVVILIRSIFRVAELWGGFDGALWNDEVDFLILDGAMISLASLCLSALHPGPAFGGQWNAANWSFRTKKKATDAEKQSSASSLRSWRRLGRPSTS
ncbi:phospholipid-translocating ATPase rsb1 [Elasticomyces elasticus]|nr:phospholipid-translocating ATPase rsb1 [Elasticomyces elasticus]KAK3622071.1 phospholipid-translocating ATPase rsb1 [Elasticomyces elasticus]KAK4905241.1 phospholipid-translocating ATPase rsb1 [Elasticomyces elasticus]KAK5747648.1 phospholipid-translocating ATPase rsb1 [Elasticomyces elasticus]